MPGQPLPLKARIVIAVLGVAAVVFGVLWAGNAARLGAELELANREVESARAALADTQAELARTSGALTLKLADIETRLESVRTELSSSQQDVARLQSEYNTAKVSLLQTQAEYLAAKNELGEAESRATSLEEDLSYLQTNYNRMTSGYSYIMNDPSYSMMLNFLAEDGTDRKPYITGQYECRHYCADVINGATRLGIRCGFVSIEFPESAHAIVVFNTTDAGLKFIDPQHDDEVKLEVGKHYFQSIVPKPGYYYPAPAYDDTVRTYAIIW